MNPTLLKLVSFIRKRPSDTTIQYLRIATGLIIILVLFLGRNAYEIDIPFMGRLSLQMEQYVEYGLLLFGIWCILLGLLKNVCLFKKEIFTKLQIAFGIFLILLGGPFLDQDTRALDTFHETQIETDSNSLGATTEAPKLAHNPSWILIILGFLPIVMGVTGKGITSTCLRYGQKVKKVRV